MSTNVPNFPQNTIVTSLSTNEVQKIDLTPVEAGKTIQVSFDGATTAASAVKASITAAALQTLLEGLPNIQPGDVTVTGATAGPFTLTFGGQYAGENVPQVTAPASAGPAATVTTLTAGGPNPDAVQVGTGNADASELVSPLNNDSPVETRAANGSDYGDS